MQYTKGFTKETLRKQQNDVKITKNVNQNVRPIIYVTGKLQTEKSAKLLFTKYFTKKIWLHHTGKTCSELAYLSHNVYRQV